MKNMLLEKEPQRRRLSTKISVVARQLRKGFDKHASARGVTGVQWGLIALVARRPELTQREIAGYLNQSEASVGRIIDRLCKEGLLSRHLKDDDRRAYSVRLTEKSGSMMAQLSAFAEEYEKSAYTGLTEAELDMLERLLDKIISDI